MGINSWDEIYILQNNVAVTRVKPDYPVRLYAGNVRYDWWDLFTSATVFTVMDGLGQTVLQKEVAISKWPGSMGDAWYDWQSPHYPGLYYFYPTPYLPNYCLVFEVADDAVTPGDPPADPPEEPSGGGMPSWVLPAAIAAMALIIVTSPKK